MGVLIKRIGHSSYLAKFEGTVNGIRVVGKMQAWHSHISDINLREVLSLLCVTRAEGFTHQPALSLNVERKVAALILIKLEQVEALRDAWRLRQGRYGRNPPDFSLDLKGVEL